MTVHVPVPLPVPRVVQTQPAPLGPTTPAGAEAPQDRDETRGDALGGLAVPSLGVHEQFDEARLRARGRGEGG